MLFLFDTNVFVHIVLFRPNCTNAGTNVCLSCRKRKRGEGGTILDIMAIHPVHHRISRLRPRLRAESRNERGHCLYGQPDCITGENLFPDSLALRIVEKLRNNRHTYASNVTRERFSIKPMFPEHVIFIVFSCLSHEKALFRNLKYMLNSCTLHS